MTIADRSAWRFIFRYVYLRDRFPSFREKDPSKETDLECFIALLNEKVSKNGKELLAHASKRFERYKLLVSFVQEVVEGAAVSTRVAEIEANALKRIIDFELRENKSQDWNLKDNGLTQISDDFILLTEYILSHASQPFVDQCQRWREFFLTPAEKQKISALPKSKREEAIVETLKPTIQPIWLYFVALCHLLQERENVLSASDAYWLSLIDEVIGSDELTLRMIIENPPPAKKRREKQPNRRKRSTNI